MGTQKVGCGKRENRVREASKHGAAISRQGAEKEQTGCAKQACNGRQASKQFAASQQAGRS